MHLAMKWAFLHRWYMPFVYITVAPMIAVPAAVYFQHGLQTHPAGELGLAYGHSWVLRDDFLATIVVYLLNLGAGIWLFNADGSTRWAAFWATLLGLGRIIMPIALATMADVELAGHTHYVDWETLRVLVWFQDAQMFLLGPMLWSAFARFVGESGGVSSRTAHFAEA
jgi:hypothetical protein